MLNFVRKIIKYRTLLIMLIPAIVFFVVFTYVPMFGILLAFKKYNYVDGIFGSPWSGIENFRFLFISGDLFRVARNTFLYNLAFIVINNCGALLVGIMLSEVGGKFFKRLTQSVLFMPFFISWVVVGAFVYNMFHYEYGFVNTMLIQMHVDPINVNSNPTIWIFIIIALNAWKSIGYGSVIYMAAISGIPQEMYEAAEIDGANVFQRIKHITLPSLIPTIIVLVLLSIGQIFKGDFSMFFQIVGNNAMVFSTTDVIDTYVTRSLLQTREFGMTSAAGLIQSVLCFAMIMIVNTIIRKSQKDYALF